MIIHRFSLIESSHFMYKYSFRCIALAAPRASSKPRSPRRRAASGVAAARARVAVAGATGYTGQELLRLLSRHPFVALGAAMSSGADRRVLAAIAGALTRLWDGVITPLSAETLAPTPTSCSSRFRIRRPRSSRRRSSTPACASSISPAPFVCSEGDLRARWYPETHRLPAGVAYGLTERERGAVARAQLVANPGCYPTATLLALAPLASAGRLLARRRHHRRRQVGRVGRGQNAVGADALLRGARQHGGVRRLQSPPRRRNRAGRRTRGHLHAASGAARPRHSVDDLRRASRRARPKKRSATCCEQAYAGATFVRLVGSALPEIKHVAHTNFCDIGWRVDAVGPRRSSSR